MTEHRRSDEREDPRVVTRLRPGRAWAVVLACGIGSAVGGCAGELTSAMQTASVGLAAITTHAGTVLSRSPVSAQETYIRIARGANSCWFGGKGAYRETHIFYADAEPSAKGGAADIVIHERDRVGERPWGLKALRVQLQPVDTQTDVVITNLKMAEADLQRMTADIARWIQGREECVALVPPPVLPSLPSILPVAQPAPVKP